MRPAFITGSVSCSSKSISAPGGTLNYFSNSQLHSETKMKKGEELQLKLNEENRENIIKQINSDKT